MILNAKTAEVIPGIRKAAILLITLGEQASADIIKDLPEEDVQRVSREIALIAQGGAVIVTGDFNTDQHTAPYEALVGGRPGIDSDLFDVFRATHPAAARHGEGTMHNFHGTQDGPRIDWILTNNLFTSVASSIDHTQRGPQFPSDHFPVKAVVRMNTALAPLPVARVE